MTQTNGSAHTNPQKLLLAAADISRECSVFSAEALCIRAWQRWPEVFGLSGFPSHPDFNRVLVNIVGARGLVARGHLEKVGPKLYRLIGGGNGRAAATLIANGLTTLSNAASSLLTRLLESVAWNKDREGLWQDVNFADACAFWGWKTDHCTAALSARIDDTTATLRFLRGDGDSDYVARGGRFVSAAELAGLAALNERLKARFAQHIALVQKRKSLQKVPVTGRVDD